MDLPREINLLDGEVLYLVRDNGSFYYRDKRGQTYSPQDAMALKNNQIKNRQQISKDNKRFGKRRFQDPYNDKSYADGKNSSYGKGELLKIGDLEFYEDPDVHNIVNLVKENREHVVYYMVARNRKVLMSSDSFFLSQGSFNLVKRYYRVEPVLAGIIKFKNSNSLLMFPGLEGNLILDEKNIKNTVTDIKFAKEVIEDRCRVSIDLYEGVKKFIEWAISMFTYKDLSSVKNRLSFRSFVSKEYTQGFPDKDNTSMSYKGVYKNQPKDIEVSPKDFKPTKSIQGDKGFGMSTSDKIKLQSLLDPRRNLLGDKGASPSPEELGREGGREKKIIENIKASLEKDLKANKINIQEYREILKTINILTNNFELGNIIYKHYIKFLIVLENIMRNEQYQMIYQVKDTLIRFIRASKRR